MTGKVTPKRLPSPRTMLGWDGTDFFAVRVDESGHLQIDILTIPLPDDAATDTALKAVRDRIGALTSPAAGSVNKYLEQCLIKLGLLDNLPQALRTVGVNALIAAGTDSVGAHRDLRVNTSGQLEVDAQNPADIVYQGDHFDGHADNVAISSGAWADILTYTVGVGEVAYLYYFSVAYFGTDELFSCRCKLNGATILSGKAMNTMHESLGVCLGKGVAGDVFTVDGYHTAGVDRMMDSVVKFIIEAA